ncbi:hypothetical protein DB30_05665 [Enhygromyxa salina]|uniref:Uncharacterized protein n=1 Tax=Enhygromyxa salina TaxID=215803 RepID=A0A0C1ZWA7_9BACT|nr:hypothetical protein DB30_05665 [Enhygromyxa salina]
MVASSANLTRRGFATNLEAAAYEDYDVRGPHTNFPSLVELRELLTTIAADSNLERSRAYKAMLDVLPTRRSHKTQQDLHFVHTADPDQFQRKVGSWFQGKPDNARELVRRLVVSPFFSARGPKLRKFAERKLGWAREHLRPIDLILDGRQQGNEHDLQSGASFSTPPRWLHELRAEGSGSFRPAVITRTGTEHTPRGSGQHGRPLHAKIIGAAWRRKRAKIPRHIWRLLIGSSNFSEGGLGLAGAQSSLEAGFLIEYEEQVEHDIFGPRKPLAAALCVPCSVVEAPADRLGADLSKEFGLTALAKRWLKALDHAKVQVERADGRFVVSIQFDSAPDGPVSLRLADEVFALAGVAGNYQVTVDTLSPYFIAVELEQRSFAWPLPGDIAGVWSELLASAAGRRRVDRLLEFWLAASSSREDPDDEDLDDGLTAAGTTPDSDTEAPLGSWRLNRLMLGLRRRLAESVEGIPPRLPSAHALLGSVRVQELLQLAVEITADADLLYFGTMVRAALLGYHAASVKGRVKWAELSSPPVGVWEDEAWQAFETRLAACRKSSAHPTLEALDDAASVIFESVREGDLVE